ncbi:hypothetical protein PGTUg99_007434 [Puccinia graminis f. sp. tritici]|uniref:Uncharacterized protein n=1 Tax=Puccinia graminis f. sp. tritici TaxID=56615 RepID=A0A5B0Q189_PUCGR|nr:hypothetical protein PGTUg99_007434 [Puccinia graminis f. sp. tritici]
MDNPPDTNKFVWVDQKVHPNTKASQRIVTPVNRHQVPNKDLKAIVPLTTKLESEVEVLIQFRGI